MKKLLLFALGFAMLTPMAQAQDEIGDDVTKYVANAGFDDDLTFQNDGIVLIVDAQIISLVVV